MAAENHPNQSDYTVEGACRYLNCSRSTVYELLKAEQLKAYKLRRSTRITNESVEALRSGVPA